MIVDVNFKFKKINILPRYIKFTEIAFLKVLNTVGDDKCLASIVLNGFFMCTMHKLSEFYIRRPNNPLVQY